MKCPECGSPMGEGQMYCEHCGKEIQIVPEFDTELENSMRAALSETAIQIGEGEAKESAVSGKHPHQPPRHRERRGIIVLTAFLLAAACACVAVIVYWRGTPDYLYGQAQKLAEQREYGAAAQKLKTALEKEPENILYLNALSACCYALGEFEEAADICLTAIRLDDADEEAYRRYVSICEQYEDYSAINDLMQQCSDMKIRSQYLDYMANPPEFDVEEGTYYEIQNVKLIANSAGTVYYTMDGSIPDESSAVYTTPILLESGEYEIKALFVNQYGIASEISSACYYIDIQKPEPPAVQPASGTYGKPTLVTLEVPEGCQVFYTTDGSEPGISSTLYEGPFWMPVGYSTFRFVTVSKEGVTGDIAKRQYTLDLHPLMSIEAASNQLLLTLKNAGAVSSMQGSVPGKEGKNIYTYKYALTVNEHDYYLYREYYRETDGISNATGNDYVVNYMSGECYRAEQLEDKSYKLYNIEVMQ